MNLNLNEFGITLAVGIFLIGLLVTSLYILFDLQPRGVFFNKLKNWITTSPMLGGLFFVVAVFGAGIVGETLSNKMVDDDLFRNVADEIFATENEIRTRTLFGFPNDPRAKVPEVARDLAATGRLSRFILNQWTRKKAEKVEARLTQSGLTRVNLESLVRRIPGGLTLDEIAVPLYYTAKNTLILKQDNVAKELTTIQSRLDFCRSLAFYSLCFFGFNMAVNLVGIGCGRASWWPLAERIHRRYMLHPVWHKLCWCAVLLLLCYVARNCYESEEREFNLRTYGYFATLSDDDLPKRAVANECAPGTPPQDISGVVLLNRGPLVIVRDAKVGKDCSGIRAATVNMLSGAMEDLEIKWQGSPSMASDLEAACQIPDSDDILLAESGYYPEDSSQYGRVFRCRPHYDEKTRELMYLEVVQVWQWPEGTTDIEGLACVKVEGQLLLIAAKRNGMLYWCPLNVRDKASWWCAFDDNKDGDRLVFSNRGQWTGGKKVNFPFMNSFDRKISDLYVTSGGEVWACAADEPQETGPSQGGGPFKSVVYHLGMISGSSTDPVILSPNPSYREVPGLKVEALARGRSETEFFIGMDNESLGGRWQFLEMPVTPKAGN